jgi:hypothetical protein
MATLKGKYCSPVSDIEAKSSGGSCYTKQQLINIASAYNQKHPEMRIALSGTKDELWNSIDKRMKGCTNEWCWMERMDMEDTFVQQYGASPFRPVRPPKPNQWLSTYDIRNVLKQYELVYPDFVAMGPVPIDFCQLADNEVCRINLKQLLASGKKRVGIVFNTDPSHMPGKHWVSMFIDLTSNPDRWQIDYFDSFGRAKVAREIKSLIDHLRKQHPNFIVNMNCNDNFCSAHVNHQRLNTECGVYSINFIVERLAGKSWNDMVINNLYDDATISSRRKVFFRPVKGNGHP